MMAVLVNLVWMYITYTQIATKIDLRDATETNSCVSLIFSISHAMRNQIYQLHSFNTKPKAEIIHMVFKKGYYFGELE